MSFEDRLKDRIKADIGQLMTDEDLSKLVHKATHDVFFAPRYKSRGIHSDKIPPLLHELVKDSLKPIVAVEVEKWVKLNKDAVLEACMSALNRGVGECMIQAFSEKFHGDLYNFKNAISSRIDGY